MSKITLYLTDDLDAGLRKMANADLRHPRLELLMILRDALRARGYLPPEDGPGYTWVKYSGVQQAAPLVIAEDQE